MRATGEGQSACTGAEAFKTHRPTKENATGPQLYGACGLVCVYAKVCVWGGFDLCAITSTAGFKDAKVIATKSCHVLTGLYPPLCLTLSPHACGHTFFVTHACGHTFFVTHARACVFRDTFFVTHACQHTFFVTHARACVFILCHPCLCWCMHVKTM
jgi:hypothetical protein